MARNARTGFTSETVEEKVSASTVAEPPADEVVVEAPKAKAAKVVVAEEAPPPAPPVVIPPTKKFRVARDHWVILDSQRFMLKGGKIVDDMNYNIELLKSQGVALEQI